MSRLALPLAALLATGALAVAGCGSSDDSSSTGSSTAAGAAATSGAVATDKVTIKDFMFGPKVAKVKLGGSVTFTNTDSAPHTATIQEGAMKFDTGTLNKGQSKTITFKKPGTYQYICLFHAYMHGTIVVTQ